MGPKMTVESTGLALSLQKEGKERKGHDNRKKRDGQLKVPNKSDLVYLELDLTSLRPRP